MKKKWENVKLRVASVKIDFLKKFPGFDFVFNWSEFSHIGANYFRWQNLCDTQNLVRVVHRHRDKSVYECECSINLAYLSSVDDDVDWAIQREENVIEPGHVVDPGRPVFYFSVVIHLKRNGSISKIK